MHNQPNQPYNLTSAHGRAQSIAHSAQGAYLADIVQSAMDEQKEDIANLVEVLLDKADEDFNLKCLKDENLPKEFEIFSKNITKSKRAEFEILLAEYLCERKECQLQLALMAKLMDALKNMFELK